MLRTTALLFVAFILLVTGSSSQAESATERLAAHSGKGIVLLGKIDLPAHTLGCDAAVSPQKGLPPQICGPYRPPTHPPVPVKQIATTSDRIKLTLRTEKETYHATPLQLLNVKRYLQNAKRLENWNKMSYEASWKIRKRMQDAAIADGKSWVGLYPTHEDIVAEIGERPAKMKFPEFVNLGYKLDVTNTSKKPVDINLNLNGDVEYHSIEIKGPGVHKYRDPFAMKTMEWRHSNKVTIEPGETRTLSLSMSDGHRQSSGPYMITEQGDFSTTITLHTSVDGVATKLNSSAVAFKVVAQ